MSVNYCQITTNTAYLNTEFGLTLACKKLNKTPEQIESLVGRYKKGKRKGQIKGVLVWRKVVKAGWVRMGAYDHDYRESNGFVCRFTNITFCFEIQDAYTGDHIFGFDNRNDNTKFELERAINEKIKEIEKFKKGSGAA